MATIRLLILAVLLAICPALHATTLVGRVADSHMHAVSGAIVTFQLIQTGHGTTPARAINLPDIKSKYRVTTRCDGSFNVKLVGNDVIPNIKTLWEMRIYGPGFEIGPYNFSITGSKLDLHIQTPQGTVDPKLSVFYTGAYIPPFHYGLGCHIRRAISWFP